MAGKDFKIIVDDGYQRVPITNLHGDEVGEFYFNPTDVGIINRLKEFNDHFNDIIEPLEGLSGGFSGEDEGLNTEQKNALETATERLYEAVNKLFNSDTAKAFFGRVHPFSPVDGEFYCTEVLNKVSAFIGEQFDVETKKIEKRTNKYTKIVQKAK